MAEYNRYPAMDAENNFPPAVRRALSNSPEQTSAVRNAVKPLVSETIAEDTTVVEAASLAADKAVDVFLESSDVIRGKVVAEARPDTMDYEAGFIGENGRPTDLVVNKSGKVPEEVIAEWSYRIGEYTGLARIDSTSSLGGGGFVGENGRETDLVVDSSGKIPQSVISDWATRMRPLLGDKIDPPEEVEKHNLDVNLGFNRGVWVKDFAGNVRPQTSSSEVFAAWGDSLTEGFPKPPFATDKSDSWPGVLAKNLNKTVFNGGISGQSADEIAIRAGGVVLILKPEGGSIPASGSVNMTQENQIIGWRIDRGFSCDGTIDGVTGTLTRAASSSVLVFKRTGTGTVVPITSPTPFISTNGVTHSISTSILMLGRNDIGYASAGTSVVDRIVSANVAIIESLKPLHPRFLILGTINSTGEYVGSTGYKYVVESNNILANLYPDNYLDIRNYIVKESIYDQKLTPTADDISRMSKDAPPVQIMHDGVHYTVSTAKTIADKVYSELKKRGWAV